MDASNTTARVAKFLGRVVAAVIIAAAALSCAPLAPTSRPAPIIERAPPARTTPPPVVTAPAPPPAAREPAVSVFPLAPPPDVESKATTPSMMPDEPRAQRPPAPTTDLVALILPLEVPAYARAAEAVRAGFLAAAEAAGEQAKVIVIGHKEDGVLAAFDQARARGVRVVVGPLLRDDLKTLALAEPEIPWTLALNQLDDRSPLPPTVFSFALTIDSDARVLAHLAQYEGVRAIDVISGDTPLMKRFAAAFVGEWTASGGRPPSDLRFDPAPEGLTLLRRNLVRAAPDAVLLAVDGAQAALVKSYVGLVRAYASGLLFDRPDAAIVRDLNDVRVVELPWLVTPDAPQLASFPRRDFASAPLDRLYALGLDAFRIAQSFAPDPPQHLLVDGATGRIEQYDARTFVREGQLAVYRDGRLVPLDATSR
jgi:outer membrane PBP1 activator LpoA protein